MKPRLLLPGIAALAFALSTSAIASSVDLFNGRDLTGWTFFAGNVVPPPSDTWTVVDGVIHCTGKPNGYIRSDGRYSNYKLTVEWRWVPVPPPVDSQGRPRNRNSGVLLHMQGEDAIWPKSIEAQLMETNAGDFFVIGGVETTELIAMRDEAIAKAGDDEDAKKRAAGNRRLARKQPSSEKPVGEWNRYEIICSGDSVTTIVNGVEQNRATGVTVSEGHICLQSEGAPIEFRNVKLEALAR